VANIVIPERLRYALGPAVKMDLYWIDVRLRDGRAVKNLVVRGDRVITGSKGDPGGEGPLDFDADDIVALRPSRWLSWGRWYGAR